MNLSAKQKDLLIIKQSEAADVLLQPDTIDLLRPFMTQALTVSEAAEHLDIPFMKLHYRVKKLAGVGLLLVSDTTVQQGRKRKRYCASAKRFFVPFGITQSQDLKSFLREHDAQWHEPMLDTYVQCLQESNLNMNNFGIGLHLNDDNLFMFSLGDNPKDTSKRIPCSPEMDTLWDTSFYLNAHDVEALQQEVNDVFERYRKKKSGSRYVLRFACAPWRL